LNDSDPIPVKPLEQGSALEHVRIEEVEYMITPEELAEAACDDQVWKQIECRAATECRATCFRAAIDILNGEIAKFPPRGPEGVETKLRNVLGGIDSNGSCLLCNATTFTRFIGYDEYFDRSRHRKRDCVFAVDRYADTRTRCTIRSGLDRNIASPKRLEFSFKILAILALFLCPPAIAQAQNGWQFDSLHANADKPLPALDSKQGAS
jgi:hypothetical protein